MKEKLLFVVEWLAISILLYALWLPASTAYAGVISSIASALRGAASYGSVEVTGAKNSTLLVPVLAAIVAAAGLTLRQKARWIAIAITSFALFDALTVATGVVGFAERFRANDITLSTLNRALGQGYHVITWLLPFLLLFGAVSWRLDVLWAKLPTTITSTCPICGKKRTGMAAHIRAVHGEKAFKAWKAKTARAGRSSSGTH